MSRRRPFFVLALAIGDYLLWNWSLNANHEVLALASGLTLPPLALVSVWLVAMAAARTLGKLSTRTTQAAGTARGRTRGRARRAAAAAAARGDTPHAAPTTDVATPAQEPPSRRIAA